MRLLSGRAALPRTAAIFLHRITGMRARDVMTARVVSVRADTPNREIARLLLENHISAVPVLDGSGAPLGMVSEG